jgi:lysophospholipase L1-like esterase
MNKDFFKPAALVLLAAVFTGILAWAIPAWNNDVFSIRKMQWFEKLQSPGATVDSAAVQLETVDHAQDELEPFLKKIGSLSALPGKEALFERPVFARKDKQVRIAYFSDSIIEGDLITAPLRQALQSVYGGKGVGMMPITSIVSGFRQTIRHSFSRNWETISFMSRDHYDISLGITGYTFIPRPFYTAQRAIETSPQDTLFVADSTATSPPEQPKTETARYYVDYDPWVEYKAMDVAGGAADFTNIRLFYSHAPDSSFVRISYDAAAPITMWLHSGEDLQQTDISPQNPVKTIRLEFPARKAVRIYGLSFDAQTGVYVDNFPIRGYSGLYFQRMHEETLQAFQKRLAYDLVILQYGGNISNPKNQNYDNYKLAMHRTITHLQEAMGDVPILLVSVQDRSVRDGTAYKTSPDIPLLVKAQSEVAAETGCAFWNLYEAMGGYNSMLGFANQNPPLAGKDYTHFTRRGADRIAEMLLKFLQGDA